jgi:glycine hydroxymethyltransferase
MIDREIRRQGKYINLIASENITSNLILKITGSILTNKYAEGYSYNRYYAGCENYDMIESFAIRKGIELFNAEYINMQPYSGSSANLAIYMSFIEFGDKILSMDLDHGGHLTHGASINFSGKFYNIINYGIKKETELVDYNKIKNLANRYKPKLIIAGASAYSRKINFLFFSKIAKKISAKFFADISHISGLIVAGLHQSPFPGVDFATTTTHKTLRGPRGGIVLSKNKYKNNIKKIVFPGLQGGPLMHIVAAKAVCFIEALSWNFLEYQKQILINTRKLFYFLKKLDYNLAFKGSDNHLILIDLCNKNITGIEAEKKLESVGIIVNKNKIPFDMRAAKTTSGIRIGTAFVTTQGMRKNELKKIALLINNTLIRELTNKKILEIKKRVKKISLKFLYY